MFFGRCGYMCVFIFCLRITRLSCVDPVWSYECEDNTYCVKKPLHDHTNTKIYTLEECKMFCDEYGLLWPRPTISSSLGNFMSMVNTNNTNYTIVNPGQSDHLMEAAILRCISLVFLIVPKDVAVENGKTIVIFLVNKNPDITELTLNEDESYTLTVEPKLEEEDSKLNVTIVGETFFGLRHGLETLSQLFVYDENINYIMLPRDVNIKDKPAYTYRGFMLDTARNYFSVDSIKRTIMYRRFWMTLTYEILADAMAAVKLNTFHWHITDSQSFPLVLEKRPEMAKYGAYSSSKVYTKENIRDVVKFAASRGVRVLPEIDAPAHVGEGWPEHLMTCFKFKPYDFYCGEPPCGQLNPIKDEVYEYLEDIYMELADSFKTDLFHVGGDEASEECWSSVPEIWSFMEQRGWIEWNVRPDTLLKLMAYFQNKAKMRIYKAFGANITLIMWTSKLTTLRAVQKYFSEDEFILQVWNNANDSQTQVLLSKGYKVIMSHHDAMYLDCGFGPWIGKDKNSCKYALSQTIYDNDLAYGAHVYRNQILGGEATMWSEMIDEAALDSRVWPRTAALAERLWSDPQSDYAAAVNRLHSMRKRLVRMGIKAASIQPEWCIQNEGSCVKVTDGL